MSASFHKMDEVPVFRASKKRKFARQRDPKSPISESRPDEAQSNQDTIDTDSNDINLTELLRLRKQIRPRGTGVQFSQQKHFDEQDKVADETAIVKVDPDEERLKAISNRFIGSTGQVVDVDKHMMDYIDSEMAKRHTTTEQDAPNGATNTETTHSSRPPGLTQPKPPSSFPPQTQLSEFDLGPSAQQHNQARTEAAIAQAQSGLPPAPEEQQLKPRRPRKPRLGRDGKPLRPRPRKRRNSSDIARDNLIEQMLHEHRMDVYDESEPSPEAGDGDADADERLAEQFKQEFMDAVAERQQRNQVKAATAAKAKGVGPEQSGPKLGGSRSARAKMAMVQQQQQQGGGGAGKK